MLIIPYSPLTTHHSPLTSHHSRFPTIVFILLLVLSATSIISQSPRYLLETFGTRNGLLSPKIYSLAQTTDRQLWIGSELGISIFNGYSFRNHQYSSENESIGRILAIAQDSSSGVWFGGDKGLFHFYKDSIIRIEFSNRPSLAIESLLTDADGNLWIGDLNFLYKMTREQVSMVKKNSKTPLTSDPFAGLKERAFSLSSDKYHNVYMASHGGIYLIAPDQNNYRLIWENPDVNNFVRSVGALSPDSIFWNHNDGHPSQLLNGKLRVFFDNDYLGKYVFTYRNRAYSVTTRDIARIENGIYPIVSFSGLTNYAHAALIDAEENIWIGSWEGLQKFRKSAFTIFNLQINDHSEVFSFLEKKNGELIFGGNRGLLYKKENNQIERFKQIPPLFPRAEVMCMYEYDDGSLWFGSGYQGISRFKNNKLTHWQQGGNLKDNNCEALYRTEDGKLLACTELGVTVIDPLQENPLVAHYDFIKKYSRHPELFGCYYAKGSGYWFYGSQGLYKLTENKLVEDSVEGLPVKNLYINKIISDNKGNTWIATQGKGLLQCAVKNGRIIVRKQYDSRNGLPSDNALSVLADKNGNIWCGDYMSLSLIKNPGNQEQILSFNEKDGLLSTYYQTLKLEQQIDGTIWGLTTMGLFSFHPDSINRNELAPAVLLENNSVARTQSTSIPEFSYKDNSMRFLFTAVSLSDPSKIQYAYRLKEADSNWTYTSNRTVNLNSLAPGNYTFELLASNNSNVWSSLPVQYRFIIHPPFWKTTWFRLLIVSLISGFVYLLFRRRINLVREKAAIKQQMAELEGKALRAQMNPHFIFNSLNAIQKLIVVQDMDASYNYLSKFSKLLRLVLDNSDKNYISLSQELEMNKLYLELESLRFKNSFRYTIELNQQTDPDIILIPSLLLQPFIENAIWHGLMHREGEKILKIRFSENNQYLTCTIEDNGIGREKSAAIKAQKLGAQYFKSKGTNLSEQRIRLLNTLGNENAKIEFFDLRDNEKEPCGTRVVIQIPLQKSNLS